MDDAKNPKTAAGYPLDRPRIREARMEEIVSDGSRHEPFCTVLLQQVSESIGGSKGQLPAKPDGLTS